MCLVFLIGGGGDHPERAETFGRFLRAATPAAGPARVALVAAGETAAEAEAIAGDSRAPFTALDPVAEIVPLLLVPPTPLTLDALAALVPTGLFVCGGSTPLYQQLLCEDRAWLSYLEQTGIPYGGLSAGAAIAAEQAIVGGWQTTLGGRVRPMLFPGASEGLAPITVRPGLGLVPFTVEIHASQWGTLTRLLHVMDGDAIPEGWAIDEHTLLQVDGPAHAVYGAGFAYHLRRDSDSATQVGIHWAAEGSQKLSP